MGNRHTQTGNYYHCERLQYISHGCLTEAKVLGYSGEANGEIEKNFLNMLPLVKATTG